MVRTLTGRDYMSDAMFGNPGTRPTVAQIIALSESSAALSTSWTVMGGAGGNELTADGFARAVGVYAHTASTQTATLQKTFTHTGPSGGGTARTIRKVGLFSQVFGSTPPGAADTGLLVFAMDEPNPPTLTGTDSLNQTVTIDLGA